MRRCLAFRQSFIVQDFFSLEIRRLVSWGKILEAIQRIYFVGGKFGMLQRI